MLKTYTAMRIYSTPVNGMTSIQCTECNDEIMRVSIDVDSTPEYESTMRRILAGDLVRLMTVEHALSCKHAPAW